MTEKETKTQAVPADQQEESWLDLATKEIVTVTAFGERRYAPQEAVFDFYVSMNTLPTRNGGK